MTDDNDDKVRFSRRKLLGSVATVGAAGALGGAATNALLWDEEVFGSSENPNVLQAGKIDLQVDWDVRYYDGIDNDDDGEVDEAGEGGVEATLVQGDGPTDLTGPAFTLNDVKPGDVLELSTYLHLYGNPAYLGGSVLMLDQSEGDAPNEPESNADDTPEEADLANYLWVAQWHDDGDNIPEEVWVGETDIGDAARGSDGDLTESARRDFIMELTSADDPTVLFDPEADYDSGSDDPGQAGGLVGVLPLPIFALGPFVYPEAVLSPLTGENADNVADEYLDDSDGDPSNDMYKCYAPTGEAVTEQLGTLIWLPRDLPGVDDNVIQGDSVDVQLGYKAIQCRHNPLESEGGNAPIDGSIDEADAEANTGSPTAPPG